MIARRSLQLGIAAFLTSSVPVKADSDEDGLTGAQRLEVLEMLEAYLLNNPDVLVKSLARSGMSASVTVDEAIARASPVSRAAFADPLRGQFVIVGNPTGQTTLVVAFDYACPFCRSLAPILKVAMGRHPSLRVMLREAPILTTESRLAASVGVAIAGQGGKRYEAYHFKLMGRRGPLGEQAIMDAAAFAGADLAVTAASAGSLATSAALDSNKELLHAIGALATPMLEVGHALVTGMLSPVELDGLIAGVPGIGR